MELVGVGDMELGEGSDANQIRVGIRVRDVFERGRQVVRVFQYNLWPTKDTDSFSSWLFLRIEG